MEGAIPVANMLHKRGLHVETILDEGGTTLVDGLFGLQQAVALVGVAEKVRDVGWGELLAIGF